MGVVWSRIVAIWSEDEGSAYGKSRIASSSSWKQICDACSGRGWRYSGITKKVVEGDNGVNLAKSKTEALGHRSQTIMDIIWSRVLEPIWGKKKGSVVGSKSEREDSGRRDSVKRGAIGGNNERRSDMNWVEAKEEYAKRRESKRVVYGPPKKNEEFLEISKKRSEKGGHGEEVSNPGGDKAGGSEVRSKWSSSKSRDCPSGSGSLTDKTKRKADAGGFWTDSRSKNSISGPDSASWRRKC